MFVETESKIAAVLIYRPLQWPYLADTGAALHQGMEAKVFDREGCDGMQEYYIRPGSVQTRLVGGHPGGVQGYQFSNVGYRGVPQAL